ncbi:MAG: substrate-binding domain-containing protein [Negativicutes bacterium]|nr:substrate-binding domain-containing protein [Negativicutes bacterium]
MNPSSHPVAVLTAGALKAVLTKLAEDFRAKTGQFVTITAGTAGQVLDKIAGGEAADLVFAPFEALARLEKQALVVAGSVIEVGKAGIGVAIREGSTPPDITTPAAFRRALFAARSLGYSDPASGASSGIYFTSVLERLKLTEAVRAKTKLLSGSVAVQLVADGKAEIGIHQITEIIPARGVTLAGPLPAELQKITVYGGGIMAKAVQPEAAAEFLAFVTGPEAAAGFVAAGFGQF